MIGIDTNVLLRIFGSDEDDPDQVAAARGLLRTAAPLFVNPIVLAEFVWTLRRTYKLDRRAIHIANLRNHFVAAVVIIETVDVGAAEQRPKFLPHPGEVESKIGDPLAIEQHASFGQIDLQIGIHV